MTDIYDLTICAGRQSLEGTLVDHEHQPKLRATIDRDSYDDQSSARVQAWTAETGWQTIHSVPITSCKIADYSYVAAQLQPRQLLDGSGAYGKVPAWQDVMESDLHDLMAYGRRFFA